MNKNFRLKKHTPGSLRAILHHTDQFYVLFEHDCTLILFQLGGASMWRVGFFGKKLVHKCNRRGVEGGKNLRNQ